MTSQKTRKANATQKAAKDNDVSPEQRRHMIEEAAYFRAQKRGFSGGNPESDWYESEQEVDRLLSGPAPAARKASAGKSAKAGAPQPA